MTKKLTSLVLILFLTFMLCATGCAGKSNTDQKKRKIAGNKGFVTKAYAKYFGAPKPIYPNTTYYVVFYPFSDQEPYLAGKVKPVAKETDADKDLPSLAISKLLQDPPLNDPMLTRLFHPETKLIGVRIKNKTAIVNFSKDILDSQVGAWGEQAIIVSLTQTLCQFKDIDKVSLEIEGKNQGIIEGYQIDQFFGHVSLLQQPFKPQDELVVTQDQQDTISMAQRFLNDAAKGAVYKYLSKATKKDVGSQAEFKKETKSDLHKVILADHGSWQSVQVVNAEFDRDKGQITLKGNRTVGTEYRENDQASLMLVRENKQWKIDFTETSEMVPTGSKEDIIIGPADFNRGQLEQIQALVDQGQQLWRRDPYKVIETESPIYGFDKSRDTFTLITKVDSGQLSGTGEALFEAIHKNTTYQIFLIQPIKAGESGIWTITMVKKKTI